MRVCPQCARKNKPRAKFCDHCGFEFVGYAGYASSTQRVAPPPAAKPLPPPVEPLPPPVEPLPPADTAKGVHRVQATVAPIQAGVPQEVCDDKGVHRQTKKLELTPNGPVLAPRMAGSGIPTARTSQNQETIKVARVPAPSGSAATPSDTPAGDPEPEATIQGAFYLRKQEATQAADRGEPVGWLVESAGSPNTPGAIFPVVAGITPMGSSHTEVETGIVTDRPGLAPLHALVFHRARQTWLVDLGSGSPTLCNGVSLSPLQGHPLSEGDELRLGELILSFRLR
jgi:FHA domain